MQLLSESLETVDDEALSAGIWQDRNHQFSSKHYEKG